MAPWGVGARLDFGGTARCTLYTLYRFRELRFQSEKNDRWTVYHMHPFASFWNESWVCSLTIDNMKCSKLLHSGAVLYWIRSYAINMRPKSQAFSSLSWTKTSLYHSGIVYRLNGDFTRGRDSSQDRSPSPRLKVRLNWWFFGIVWTSDNVELLWSLFQNMSFLLSTSFYCDEFEITAFLLHSNSLGFCSFRDLRFLAISRDLCVDIADIAVVSW